MSSLRLPRTVSGGRLDEISWVWLVWGKAVALPRYREDPRIGTIPERLLQKRSQTTFDPDFWRFPCRRRHDRNPIDDRAQGLRQPVVIGGQVGSYQRIQLVQIAKVLVDDLRMKRDDLRRFTGGRKRGCLDFASSKTVHATNTANRARPASSSIRTSPTSAMTHPDGARTGGLRHHHLYRPSSVRASHKSNANRLSISARAAPSDVSCTTI